MKQMSPFKKAIFWLIFVLFFTLIPLLLLEGGGRLYVYFKHGVEGKSYGLWRYDEVLGAQHREHAYNTNAETNDYGFRNKQDVMQPKPEGAFRIITYGGSTTFCYNLLNDEAWPLQLQSVLREKRHSHDQVLNGGAILWSLGHAYARAKKDIPELRPDYVIIYSGINEETNAGYLARQGLPMQELVEQQRWGEFATNYDQNRWVKRNLFIVRVLDYIIKPFFENRNSTVGNNTECVVPETKTDTHIEQNYLHVLKDFIALIEQHGGQAVFVIQAQGNNSETNKYLTSYSVAGAHLAAEQGAIVVDAQDLVNTYADNSMDLFYYSGVHYSKLGATKLAEFIFEKVFAEEAKENKADKL